MLICKKLINPFNHSQLWSHETKFLFHKLSTTFNIHSDFVLYFSSFSFWNNQSFHLTTTLLSSYLTKPMLLHTLHMLHTKLFLLDLYVSRSFIYTYWLYLLTISNFCFMEKTRKQINVNCHILPFCSRLATIMKTSWGYLFNIKTKHFHQYLCRRLLSYFGLNR